MVRLHVRRDARPSRFTICLAPAALRQAAFKESLTPAFKKTGQGAAIGTMRGTLPHGEKDGKASSPSIFRWPPSKKGEEWHAVGVIRDMDGPAKRAEEGAA